MGQVLYDPLKSARATGAYDAARSDEVCDGDLGEFLGDLELLLIRVDQQADDCGQVLVATPLDERRSGDGVGSDLADFFDRYIEARGAKFWETSTGPLNGSEAQ
ncbi:MAG: hypothetical protein JWQ08_2647 [Deinococcus sp.]|nr:hypothetical protein [Deinococcus sp.]